MTTTGTARLGVWTVARDILGAVAIVLCMPFVILLVGLPVAGVVWLISQIERLF